MKPRVYLETTIPSYLTAWLSRDLVRAAHQQLTREWWEKRREQFELFVSQVVVGECQAGDATAAQSDPEDGTPPHTAIAPDLDTGGGVGRTA